MMAHGPDDLPPDMTNVMLVSAHDWFASALQAVLEPEGFVFARVRSARVAVRDASQVNPDLVIIDEGLPDMDAPSLASSLGRGVLKRSVPILVYSPNFWHENEQAAAMRAGAWDIIKEPVRSNLVVAKLRRLLEIKQLIESTEQGSLSDMATGLYNLAGMMRMLRVMGSTARRHGASLTCVVVGPTEKPGPGSLDALRERAARLWGEGIRESDACGWVDSSELGIVAYGTDAAGATTLVRRLTETTAEDPTAEGLTPVSAGIVELTSRFAESSETEARQVAPMATRIAGLS
ncbi:MAG: response regulator, partial [Gemmatimonadetes bacterium]|nr:response regulator [Gemmatimonadota bacterium]